mgnify:CR=1 FL=1
MFSLIADHFEAVLTALSALGVAAIGVITARSSARTKAIDKQVNHRPGDAPRLSTQIDRLVEQSDKTLDYIMGLKVEGAAVGERVRSLEQRVSDLELVTVDQQKQINDLPKA